MPLIDCYNTIKNICTIIYYTGKQNAKKFNEKYKILKSEFVFHMPIEMFLLITIFGLIDCKISLK